jgi:3-mercaptopyruvate sulfurtransferase SseA
VALQLRRYGIRNVRPLLGGFYAWKDSGFPLVEVQAAEVPAPRDFLLRAEDIA